MCNVQMPQSCILASIFICGLVCCFLMCRLGVLYLPAFEFKVEGCEQVNGPNGAQGVEHHDWYGKPHAAQSHSVRHGQHDLPNLQLHFGFSQGWDSVCLVVSGLKFSVHHGAACEISVWRNLLEKTFLAHPKCLRVQGTLTCLCCSGGEPCVKWATSSTKPAFSKKVICRFVSIC